MAKGEKLRAWKKENMVRLQIDLNRRADADIIAKLEEQPSKAVYVKKLIRDDIESGEGDK